MLNKVTKTIAASVLVLVLLAGAGCNPNSNTVAQENAETNENADPLSEQDVFRAEDFAGKSFAIITGSIWDTILNENIPDAVQVHFSSVPETVLALRQG
ncbi:MAG: hypothetical protein FWH20_10545, partial [Oscillospiraceae bacterium]|nr:hypothetical protein [Oscillospiraceae bacterium]